MCIGEEPTYDRWCGAALTDGYVPAAPVPSIPLISRATPFVVRQELRSFFNCGLVAVKFPQKRE